MCVCVCVCVWCLHCAPTHCGRPVYLWWCVCICGGVCVLCGACACRHSRGWTGTATTGRRLRACSSPTPTGATTSRATGRGIAAAFATTARPSWHSPTGYCSQLIHTHTHIHVYMCICICISCIYIYIYIYGPAVAAHSTRGSEHDTSGGQARDLTHVCCFSPLYPYIIVP